MPRRKLTAAFVRTVDRAGKYGDEHGLILRVRPTGSKQWIWRGTVGGRRVDLGLGGYPYTSLAEARQTAFEHRKCARAGGDPRARARNVPTFADAADKVIAIHRPSWRPGSKSEG
ncbi:MAG: Arm DNA-binding domain-containing protein [Acidobacteria bacterium]|nr:Arm DNA-binding domain-containing protein [Acidobacteriota bacterium]